MLTYFVLSDILLIADLAFTEITLWVMNILKKLRMFVDLQGIIKTEISRYKQK